ncbi:MULTISPECIES: hypothetical protein [unclassified Vibrio]|uniref:hypothetical protein n=1 Tax=unclassified Vibrio TaxID=2614977 RepID=UPI001481DEC5|nr:MULTISPECIES: hypothetical protein [unclassified Vibrio]NNN45467.1 hypothetical protein [Vibrio sp. 1-1(7)]NNN73249.1 hypothetical protein [Vibrio sp. 12-2(3-a)]
MKKTLVATAILSSLALVGCGGSSSSDKVTPEAKASVSGVVNKGLVKDGLVEVCPATAANVQNKACDTPLASTTTGEDGGYSFTGLPQNQALLFVLKKHPEKETQMKCDYQACIQGDMKFGEFFPVDNNFKLISILAPDAENITAHMTKLTDVVAQYTARNMVGDQVSPEAITRNRSVIAQTLGLPASANIEQLGAVDLTKPAAVTAALADENNAASIEVAALSLALFEKDEGAIQSFFAITDKFNNGAGLTDDDKTVITGTLGNSSGAVTFLETELKKVEPSVSLSDVSNSLNKEDRVPDKIELPKPTPNNDVTKAQDLVKQVRTVYNAAGEEGDLRLGLTQWGDSLQAIPSELFEDDMAQAFEALQSGLMSIAHQVDDRLKGEAGEYDEAISAADGVYTLKIDDTLDLAVVASVNWPEGGEPTVSEDGWQREQDHAPKIELTITRLSVTSGEVTLTAESGLAQVIEFKSQEARLENNKPWDDEAQEYAYSYEEEYALTADKLALKLEGVTLTAKDQNKKTIELSGTITFSADKAKVAGVELNHNQSNWKDGPNEGSHTKFESQTIAAEKLNLTFNTELNYLEQLAKLNLAINLDNPANKVVYLSCMRDAASWIDDNHTWSNQHEDGLYLGSSKCSKDGENWSLDEETATDFLRGSVTASLETEVNPAKPQLAKVSLQAARPAFDLLNVNGAVVYNDQTLNLKTQINTLAEDQTLTVELANAQATAVLREGDKKGEILGEIKVGNKTVATIEYVKNTSIVRYSNGQFESLF